MATRGREEEDQALFDRIAQKYAAKDVYAPSKYARQFLIQSLFDLLKENTGQSPRNLLEIGCGTGATSEHLKGQFDHYIGLDYSSRLIEIGKSRYEREGVELYQGNAKDVEMGKIHPDFIFGNGVLHHVDDLPSVFATLKDLGSPKTFYGFIEPQSGNPFIQLLRFIRKRVDPAYSGDQVFFSKKELLRLFEENGFEVVALRHQGYFSTPIAQVMLKPEAFFMAYSRVSVWLDRNIQRGASLPLAWNLQVIARKK